MNSYHTVDLDPCYARIPVFLRNKSRAHKFGTVTKPSVCRFALLKPDIATRIEFEQHTRRTEQRYARNSLQRLVECHHTTEPTLRMHLKRFSA
mmetsp:Transcript_20604/g.68065  ORF Transcript_20604/g.68065 Transcript_20604/m.68065 type:complete len:93 (-) Transcript_20604:1230-1508(-)